MTSRVIRVNVAEASVLEQAVTPEYLLRGGRHFTSRVVAAEIPPTCDPLGPENKVVIAPALLAGTVAPSTNRTSVGGKSPLTGTIKESNVGGTPGKKFGTLGIKGLIVEGQPKPDQWFVIVVDRNGCRLESAAPFLGLGNYELVERLRASYGRNVGILSIGPAGERLMAVATVAATDNEGYPSRHAGRGGLGAVLGSKHVKAIVLEDAGARAPEPANPAEFRRLAKELARKLVEEKKILTNYGTAVFVNIVNKVGGLPHKNFQSGRFGDAENLSGERLAKLAAERGGRTGVACTPGCAIRCSNIFVDKEGHHLTSGLEYETLALMGANLAIGDIDLVAALDRACDDAGIDTMEMADTIGVAMEAGLLPFGDGEGALRMIREVAQGSVLGSVLGQGCAVAGRVLRVRRVPAVKGQGVSGYDPRAFKGTGVTYSTCPMGADHTAANCLPGRKGFDESKPALDTKKPDGQALLSKEIQEIVGVLDGCICYFVGATMGTIEYLEKLIDAQFGVALTAVDLLELSRETIRIEMAFNQAAGFTAAHDRLPSFFRNERLLPEETAFDVPQDEIDRTFRLH